jgi:Transglycosylase SLT domain
MRHRRRSWLGAWTLAPLLVGALIAGIIVTALGATITTLIGAANACSTPPGPAVDVFDIPASLMPIYQQAAARYQLGSDGWAYLASINYQETDFGHNLSTSSAGAVGWMQFEPGTWVKYGVAVDPASPGANPDPYDPWDAIFSAANYLHASGAPADWIGALTIYGNAGWYAQQVSQRAERYISAAGGQVFISYPAGSCAQPIGAGGYANPFAHSHALTTERIDMGVDYSGSGEIDAIGNARVTFAHTGIGGGWVCSTPENGGVVYQLTDGQYHGAYIYVTEDVIPTVQQGQQVSAGQHIATFTSPHGCLEIGFANGPSPAPLAAALGQQAGSGDAGDNRTYCGQQMSDLLAAAGAPPGLSESKPLSGDRCE